jgi:hypothetical protein
MVFQLFGVTWVMPGRMKDCLRSWREQKGNRTVLQIWRMVSLYVMWCQWRDRNARSFENHELGLIELKKMVLQTLYSWRVMWHSSQALTLFRFMCFIFRLKAFAYLALSVYFLCTCVALLCAYL